MVVPHLQKLMNELAAETDTDYLNILLSGFNQKAATERDTNMRRDLDNAATEVGKRLEQLRGR